MTLTFLVIAICLAFGAAAIASALRPRILPEIGHKLSRVEKVKSFSPRDTLFLIGPDYRHGACRLQRRLLKPALPVFIGADIDIIELYGDETPLKNGERIEWLHPDLLRHALGAERGFSVIYIDDDGKPAFRAEQPTLARDLLARLGLDCGARAGRGALRAA